MLFSIYIIFFFFFFNDTATTEIYTLSLHDALPISLEQAPAVLGRTPLWLGRRHEGLPLTRVYRETTSVGHQHRVRVTGRAPAADGRGSCRETESRSASTLAARARFWRRREPWRRCRRKRLAMNGRRGAVLCTGLCF